MPHQGLNAAGMLLIALAELQAGGGSREPIQALAQVLGIDYDGAGLGIKQADELSGALTCNLGILRYDGCQLHRPIGYPLSAVRRRGGHVRPGRPWRCPPGASP